MEARRRRWSRGQIVLPSLLVIPSLMLFVYLIYETAKLSREKIRHQFAVDSASFVEMTNYADFMNRTAYVNGAFPMRIFAEGFFNGPNIPLKKNDAMHTSLYDILYCNGAFPSLGDKTHVGTDPSKQDLASKEKWKIEFQNDTPCGDQNVYNDYMGNDTSIATWGELNSPSPPAQFPGSCNQSSCLQLLTKANAMEYYISWEDAQDIYKLYVQIYQLLGSVEDAQYSVFRRLTGGANSHTFFRKSYWLNTGDPVTDAKEGAGYFHTIHPKAECIRYINICGNKPTNDPYQPYKPVEPEHPIEMPNTVSNELCDGGLFHFAWVPQSEAQDVQVHGSGSGGYGIIQHWTAPNNYFKINFNNMSTCGTPGENKPCIHATIGLTGKGSVWPDPTPKFQTRMYP